MYSIKNYFFLKKNSRLGKINILPKSIKRFQIDETRFFYFIYKKQMNRYYSTLDSPSRKVLKLAFLLVSLEIIFLSFSQFKISYLIRATTFFCFSLLLSRLNSLPKSARILFSISYLPLVVGPLLLYFFSSKNAYNNIQLSTNGLNLLFQTVGLILINKKFKPVTKFNLKILNQYLLFISLPIIYFITNFLFILPAKELTVIVIMHTIFIIWTINLLKLNYLQVSNNLICLTLFFLFFTYLFGSQHIFSDDFKFVLPMVRTAHFCFDFLFFYTISELNSLSTNILTKK
jgi:hypothetical protein